MCFLKIRLLGSNNWEQLGSVEQSVWPVASVKGNLDSISVSIWDTSCRLVGPGNGTFFEHITPSKTTVSSTLSHTWVLRWGPRSCSITGVACCPTARILGSQQLGWEPLLLYLDSGFLCRPGWASEQRWHSSLNEPEGGSRHEYSCREAERGLGFPAHCHLPSHSPDTHTKDCLSEKVCCQTELDLMRRVSVFIPLALKHLSF